MMTTSDADQDPPARFEVSRQTAREIQFSIDNKTCVTETVKAITETQLNVANGTNTTIFVFKI